MSGGVADLDKLIRKGISSLKLRINDKTSKDGDGKYTTLR